MRTRPFFLLALAACSPPSPSPPPAPQQGACVGSAKAAAGLREVQDEALRQRAIGKSGEGKLCAGRVYEATEPVVVYRVWSKAAAWTLHGRWWSLDRPAGPVETYRRDNAICPEWSALDVVSECRLKVGARVVIGPGQSATCETTSFAASATNQVFIPNDHESGALFVEGCSSGAPWP